MKEVEMDQMAKVYVYLWFDIEDYVTNESHELPLIAFSILKKYNVPVTCKIVAEKVRALKENGRNDVIDAIRDYDVGYHLDTHSRHPTVYEYLADLDIRSGSKEFLARENEGFQYVKEVFGRTPSCFGHPGPAWAPHVYPALLEMGVSAYLDESAILNLDDQPYWYCGMLNLNGANRNFISFDFTFEKPDGIDILKRKFKSIYDRIQKGEGGAISVLFHLHTSINRKFWDEVNFGKGVNRNKEEYQRPPAQPAKISNRAWETFDELIAFMKQFKDVEFITATDALKIYPTRTPTELNETQLRETAKHFSASTDYLRSESFTLSPAEGLYAIVSALNQYASENTLAKKAKVKQKYGPITPYRGRAKTMKRNVQTSDFLASTKNVLNYMENETCIPSSIRLNDQVSVRPQDYLVTASKLLASLQAGRGLPKALTLSKGQSPHLRLISASKFRRACMWKVLPINFSAPKILEQIRLQAWTLKPAIQER